MPLRRLLVLALVGLLCLSGTGLAPASAAGQPSRSAWLRVTATAMNGAQHWVGYRVAHRRQGARLAVVLDIDNTSLQSHYAYPEAVPAVQRYAAYARSRGVRVFFATGRDASQTGGVAAALSRAGYASSGICHRQSGETLVHGKVRCRATIMGQGYAVIAMIGNRATDFTGGGWEHSWRLPNYGNRLG